MKKTWSGFIATSVLALGLATSGWAATVTVTNTNDTGAGSLRAAIASAANGDTIDFNLSGCPCTITTASVLTINKGLIINGPGANQLTISGANAHPVLNISGLSSPVTLSGLTIANGTYTGTGGGGGILVSNSSGITPVTISNCVVTNNVAASVGANSGYGGGIFLANGTLTVLNTTFSNNNAAFAGGAIATPGSGPTTQTLTIVGSTISNNTSATQGGGVYLGTTAATTSLNSTFTGNTAGLSGGGFYNSGTAVIRGGAITLNHATASNGAGGGLFNATNTAELIGVNVSNNNTANSGRGAGIYSSGPLVLTQSIVSNNQSGAAGGIESLTSLTMSDTTVAGNMASDGAAGLTGGGGITLTGGTATITGCTVSGNSVNGSGGGIANSAATMTVMNSTISGNQVGTLVGQSLGGGIAASDSSTTNLSNCTITLNTSQLRGGGIATTDSGSVVNVDNTIIAGNTAPSGADLNGTFVSNGYNLIGSNASQFSQGFTNGTKGDIVGGLGANVINPLLAPLADNGGPTRTHALQDGSPAIDKGSSRFNITTDQRGEPRFVDVLTVPNPPGGNFSDMGAFETTPLQLIGAASRKTHGTAGTFDVDLPVTGAPGIEDRSSGGAYTIVFKFTNPVTAGTASVTTGTGSVSGVSFNGSEMLVNLTGVTNAQYLTVTANNVGDVKTHVLAAASVNVGFLIGDTNGNRSVNATDISQAKAVSGATATATNFREDINVNGQINATDISLVKAMSGTSLPTPPGGRVFERLAESGSSLSPNDEPASTPRRVSSR